MSAHVVFLLLRNGMGENGGYFAVHFQITGTSQVTGHTIFGLFFSRINLQPHELRASL